MGLGYVGLPIAIEFGYQFKVLGYDINSERIAKLRCNEDPSHEVATESFHQADIYFTDNIHEIADASFYIIAVPTPVDHHKVPNLSPLKNASKNIGSILKAGDCVVYESTVYPGCTEEICIPILEETSNLKAGKDFKVGYSPERINPGDKINTITRITKVVSGNDIDALHLVSDVYKSIIVAGVHQASSIKVAEAAKIIENTQRDLNIALMNELSIIFDRMNIDTLEVIEAAGTKWNFAKFYPGLVGGHCIGVDPYYLTYKAIELGYEPEVILSGRRINDEMGSYITKKAIQLIIRAGKYVSKVKVLVMGATFKENVSDIRNSKVSDLVKELESFSVKVDVTDPLADSKEVVEEYGFALVNNIENDYDCVIVAVGHEAYLQLDETYFKNIMNENGILIDVKGIYKNKIKDLIYWTL